MSFVHETVLLEEAIAAMNIVADGIYVDGTFGRGGHSAALLDRLGPGGRLLALDKDPQAIEHAKQRFAGDARFSIHQASFAQLEQVAKDQGIFGQIDGLLLDLGISSPQVDDAARGFSFSKDGPLDMRMDNIHGESAAQWLAHAKVEEIAWVLREYGEERFAQRIARALVEARQQHPIVSTAQLAALIAKASPIHDPHKHPATRSFQAIRIHINNELGDLHACLQQALKVLKGGARLVVISFHSLEDRIVKRFMKELSQPAPIPKGLPLPEHLRKPGVLKLIGKPVTASEQEVQRNPRARSAIMRVAEVLP